MGFKLRANRRKSSKVLFPGFVVKEGRGERRPLAAKMSKAEEDGGRQEKRRVTQVWHTRTKEEKEENDDDTTVSKRVRLHWIHLSFSAEMLLFATRDQNLPLISCISSGIKKLVSFHFFKFAKVFL